MATLSSSYEISGNKVNFTFYFSGGDASYIGMRYCKLTMDGYSYVDSVPCDGTSGSATFKITAGPFSSGVSYSWEAVVGYLDVATGQIVYVTWNDGYKTTGTIKISASIASWTWENTNGNATPQETINFQKVFLGTAPADAENLSSDVWNDLVDKVNEVCNEKGNSWDSTYLSLSNTKVKAGETLSAMKYNSLKYQIDQMKSTGIPNVSTGDRIYDYHFFNLTSTLNSIISS